MEGDEGSGLRVHFEGIQLFFGLIVICYWLITLQDSVCQQIPFINDSAGAENSQTNKAEQEEYLECRAATFVFETLVNILLFQKNADSKLSCLIILLSKNSLFLRSPALRRSWKYNLSQLLSACISAKSINFLFLNYDSLPKLLHLILKILHIFAMDLS